MTKVRLGVLGYRDYVQRIPASAREIAYDSPIKFVFMVDGGENAESHDAGKGRLWRTQDGRYYLSDFAWDTEFSPDPRPFIVEPCRSFLDWVLQRPWPKLPGTTSRERG